MTKILSDYGLMSSDLALLTLSWKKINRDYKSLLFIKQRLFSYILKIFLSVCHIPSFHIVDIGTTTKEQISCRVC